MRIRPAIFLCLSAFLVLSTAARAQGPGRPPVPPATARPPAPPPPPPPPPTGNPANANGGPSASGGNAGAPPRPSVTGPGGLKLGPQGRWWDEKHFVQTIGLTAAQQKKMDTIFDQNKPAIIASYKTFIQKQADLQAATKSGDKTLMFNCIDQVNQARAALEKANTAMLLEIRQELSPAQVSKLDNLP